MRVRAVTRIVCSRVALSRCLPTAVIVGTILSLVNQGSVILAGDAFTSTWIRIFFNYIVPFTVSNVGFVSAALARDRDSEAFDLAPSDE